MALQVEIRQDSTYSPLPKRRSPEEEERLSALNRRKFIVWGPVSDSISVKSGSSAYRISGADTLNFGDPAKWVQSKGILVDLRLLPGSISKALEGYYGLSLGIPVEGVMDLIQHRRVVEALTPQQVEEPVGVISQQEIEDQIAHYERTFGMSSEEFMQQVQEGTAPDTFEAMHWRILLRYR